MQFSSFIPGRDGARKRPRPTTPPTADDGAPTLVPGWQGILNDHIRAQILPPPLHERGPTPPIPPFPTRVPSVDFRQTSNPPIPQRQSPPSTAFPNNDATTVFPKIARPPQDYRYPSQELPTYKPQPPRPFPQTPTSHQTQIPPANPNDFTQVMQKAEQENPEPVEAKRFLRYYNIGHTGLISVAGFQIHSANAYGVLITENMTSRRTLIPWHRVRELQAEANDSILTAR